ncbi:unnamed protein product [Eruca vesicaria subsp. sativa]|uniref:Uncharacterized protein n=1 Tax=Eruca vesicaria subsp. sativa TaxID=29727 RepID=A0ABC8JXI2_ERUVS|nr:unnamed protein product [Eruca vesicaria subsp. sativa]
MEGRKLNLYAPLPSIRRISSKKEHPSESENKKTSITRPEPQSFPSKEQETPVFVLPDQSFDHLSEPASVPFVWEQIPGKPKDDMATLIQESGLLETDDEEEEEEEDLDTVSSNRSFSVNCSTSGVSDIDKSDDASSSRESLDLMMSRFLPAAKAMAFTHQKHQSPSSSYNSSEQKQTVQNREALVIRQRRQLIAEHEHFAIVQSLYDDLNIEDDDESDDEDEDDHRIYPEVTIKKACGFLPRLCARNSFKFSNPVPLDSRLNRSLKHSGDQTGTPNWSTRRLSGFISPYRTSCSETGLLKQPESFKRLNRGISKSQELYQPRTRREALPNYSHSGEVSMFRNSISTPSRIQRTTMHDSRFLVEEVNRRKSSSINRSGNLLKASPEYTAAISPPPLPETPSRPWLRKTLLPPVSPRPYVLGQVGTKKVDQEILESTKWETIVKTSYVHNDHVRYSQELVVHPSRQQNT